MSIMHIPQTTKRAIWFFFFFVQHEKISAKDVGLGNFGDFASAFRVRSVSRVRQKNRGSQISKARDFAALRSDGDSPSPSLRFGHQLLLVVTPFWFDRRTRHVCRPCTAAATATTHAHAALISSQPDDDGGGGGQFNVS